MCHIQKGALLSPDKALVVCQIPKIHGGEGAQGRRDIFHTEAQSHRALVCVTHTQGGKGAE